MSRRARSAAVLGPTASLATVLQSQGKLAEAEAIWREALAIVRKSATNDPPELDGFVNALAEIHYRQGKYAEAEPLYRELLQIRRDRLPPEHEDIYTANGSLARLLADWAWSERGLKSKIQNPKIAGRAREAERLLRDCLASRMRGTNATIWRTGDVRSRLGGALVSVAVTDAALSSEASLAKLTEAEALLLEGNEALQRSKSADSKYKHDALERLDRLYEAWDELASNTGKGTQAAEWKTKLADFDETETEKQAVAPKL